MKKVVLCPPDYFDIQYEINPWMDLSNKVNKRKVQEEYQDLKNLYRKLDVEIFEINPAPDLPDMVYTINTGWAENGHFIKANFRFPQRRREAELMKNFFEKKLSFEALILPEEVFFEGGGDLLKAGEKYFLGWGKRSDIRAKSYLESFLKKSVVDLRLDNPYFYHLDTCFAPLSEKVVVINEKAFSEEELNKIKENFDQIIFTNDQDNQFLGCNIVTIRENVIITKGVSEILIGKISAFGFRIHQVEMDEYLKSGGSVKCVSLPILS